MKRTIAFVLCVILDLIVIVYEKKRVKKKKKKSLSFSAYTKFVGQKGFRKDDYYFFFLQAKDDQ